MSGKPKGTPILGQSTIVSYIHLDLRKHHEGYIQTTSLRSFQFLP